MCVTVFFIIAFSTVAMRARWARITRLGKGVLEDYNSKLPENINWEKAIFKPQAGQVYVIKTKDNKIVLFEIITFRKKQIQFRYRFLK